MMRLIAWTLTWLAVCPLAFAAPTVITRYVDRDTGDNGNDGTSPETAWATMFYAESQFNTYGQNGDGEFTVTGGTYPEGIEGLLYCSGSTPDTTAVTWNVITDSTHPMRIVGDGDYTYSGGTSKCTISTACITFEDVQFQRTVATANGQECVRVAVVPTGGWQRFRGCAFTGADDETYTAWLVYTNDADAVIELNNCKIIDAGSVEGSRAVYAYAGTIYVYNCTIDNCYYGIQVNDIASAKIYAKNTIVTGSAGDAYSNLGAGTIEATNCTGDDATVLTFDTGETCTGSVSPTFAGDYQLASTDTTWIDGGMDLSADDHWHDDDVDYADTSRPQGSAWDIGWHEYESGGTYIKFLLSYARRWW